MDRSRRVEVVLVIAIVVVATVYTRWVYIPPFAERHVAASEEKYHFDVGEPGSWFSAWSIGDGQAYALVALDPSGKKLANELHREAGYRFARAGFGWAAWASSLGRPDFVPYGMAIVGVLSIAGVVWVAIRARPLFGPSVWLLVLNPALYIGLAGDTAEPLGALLLAAAMMHRSWAASALLGMTYPTFLLALWGRWRDLAIGVGAALTLASYSFVVFGPDAMLPSGGRLGLPLAAYFQEPSGWVFALAGLALLTVGMGLRAANWTWVVCGVLVLCFGSDVLRDPVNAWRAAGMLPVIWALGSHRAAALRGSRRERSIDQAPAL